MHSCQHIKEIDTIPAVLFIPLAIDAIRAFCVSLLFNLMRSNTNTHLRNRCTKDRGLWKSNFIILISLKVTFIVFAR